MIDDFDPQARPTDPLGRPMAERYASEEDVPRGPLPPSLGAVIGGVAAAAERAHRRYEAAREEFYRRGGECFNCRDSGLLPLRGEVGEADIYCSCDAGNERRRRAAERQLADKLRDAGGHEYTLPLDSHPLGALAKWALTDWVEGWPDGNGADHPWLLLVGVSGSGKSQIAAHLMRRLMEQTDSRGAFIDCVQLIADLRERAGKGDAPPRDLYRARESGVVVLDDIASWKHSDYAEEQLFTIIARRYAARWPTIITTNLDTDDDSLARLIGDRSFGRIIERSFVARIGTSAEDNLRLRRG